MKNIKKIASHFNITTDTLRYYEKKGIISPVKRNGSGYRYYTKDNVKEIEWVLHLKHLGFSLNNIKQIMEKKRDITTCTTVKTILQKQKKELESELILLKDRVKKLNNLIEKCSCCINEACIFSCPSCNIPWRKQ